jgi:tyrosinase
MAKKTPKRPKKPATPAAPAPGGQAPVGHSPGTLGSVVTRQSVEAIQAQPASLAALRSAYQKMQALRGSDNRSWIYWAGIHGFPQWLCWHHGRVGSGTQRPYDLFLPWHRAYLLYFENAARDQDGGAVLPWWDWTSPVSHTVGVPASFSQANVNGVVNPLASGPVPPAPPDPARRTQRFPGAPADLPTPADVEQVLNLTSFVDFTAQLQDIHDQIHGWTGGSDETTGAGGDMGSVATSAYDPIFWSHHGMIDRLWYLWQLRHGVTNIPPDYLSRPLAPFELTVADVLDIRTLGYEYAVAVVNT